MTVVESPIMTCPAAAPRTARPNWSPSAKRAVHPCLVPGADEALAPLVVNQVREAFSGGLQRAAQRVAVKVGEDPLGQEELVAVGRQRIAGVQRDQFARQGISIRAHEVS
jgi:hypothetical protein